jgi:hypothetical protein
MLDNFDSKLDRINETLASMGAIMLDSKRHIMQACAELSEQRHARTMAEIHGMIGLLKEQRIDRRLTT